MNENEKLLPEIPVLTEYNAVKTELTTRIKTLNEITELTEENRKEVKTSIAEINKVKERISRYRIDNTNAFLTYIQPYIDKCKELETLCDTGLAGIKQKVKDLETKEKEQKKATVKKLFDFLMDGNEYTKILEFDLFFDEKMTNKSSSLNVIENELKDKIAKCTNDISFINSNCDEPQKVINIYRSNGFDLSKAIQTYQANIATEADIAASMAATTPAPATGSFEKKLDIVITIKQLPKSKAEQLTAYLKTLGIEFEVKKL